MATAFQWMKLGLENAKIILPVLMLLLATTGYTLSDNLDKSQELEDSQAQITAIADHFYQTTQIIVQPQPCCDLKDHLREYH